MPTRVVDLGVPQPAPVRSFAWSLDVRFEERRFASVESWFALVANWPAPLVRFVERFGQGWIAGLEGRLPARLRRQELC
jgi:hypothetical protein